MSKEKNQKRIPRDSCIRCGTCCMKGGPALHQEDKNTLLAGHVGHQHLVTIRKGELAFNPVSDKLEPVPRELIKVQGKGKGWTCCFYNKKEASCAIYAHRFIECRLLKCWDTSKLISVIGKNTIIRADIINPNDPILKVIETHEQECPYKEAGNLILNLSHEADKSKTLSKLTELVRKDLSIRSYAISELELKKEFELFIFGRPLFKVLSAHGLSVRLANGGNSPEVELFLSKSSRVM